MSQVDEVAAESTAKRGRGGLLTFRRMVVILVLLLLLVIAGGAAWYFFLGERAGPGKETVATNEPPLPSYLPIKPFVVSMMSGGGIPHFVQLGIDLTLSDAAAGNVINAVLPEIQDAIRQSMLTFKVDDLVMPAGIDRMRAAMLTSINRVLLQRLGADRVKRLSSGDANGGVVQNVYFSTLVIE
jgi:flagellar FliL protein